MNFVWISPQFPKTYWNFCDRLKSKGVNVLGIGDSAYEELSEELKNSLSEYYRVDNMEDYNQMYAAVAYFAFHYGKIDWLESNNEYWLEQDAHLRTDFNIVTGFKLDQIYDNKSKAAMKEFYHYAGVNCARYQMVTTYEKAKAFAHKVGYPIILKPDVGVGAQATFKVKSDIGLKKLFNEEPLSSYIMEEFIEGIITSYDGIANSQREVLYDTSHIFPSSIMDIVNEQGHLAYYTQKEVPADVRDVGRRVVKAFRTNSRFFHFEFFRLTKAKEGLGEIGDLVALEVNMRPPGGYTPDMMNFAGSIDIYRIYADMVMYDQWMDPIDKRNWYCVYVSTRDGKKYLHSKEEVNLKYKKAIKMQERMPEVLAGAMGNDMYIACFETLKAVQAFIQYVQAPLG
ncbi:MAG: carbamoylphosphate synthase large subunit [Erysipelotrichaceae bacterium]